MRTYTYIYPAQCYVEHDGMYLYICVYFAALPLYFQLGFFCCYSVSFSRNPFSPVLFTFLLYSILFALKCENLTDALLFHAIPILKMFVRNIYLSCDISLPLLYVLLVFFSRHRRSAFVQFLGFFFYLCSN